MKILIDATGLVKKPTGLGRYCQRFLDAILKYETIDFTVLYQKSIDPINETFDQKRTNTNWIPVEMPVIGPKRDLIMLGMSRLIRQHDIYHCLSSYMPFFGIKKPSVLTIHDLKYLFFPHFLRNQSKAIYYKWIISRGIKTASKIIAVSNATCNDLIRVGVNPSKITVIYEASTLEFDKNRKEKPVIGDFVHGYFLYVGEDRPHKNIARLINAYKIVHASVGAKCPSLVLVGPKFSITEHICVNEKKLSKIAFINAVSDDQLKILYQCAVALVFPSLYEGFGLPILEAMSAGTPVITSNISSMSEIADKAAVLVDPYSENEIAAAMLKIYGDREYSLKLRREGLKRAHDFSWGKTALQTIECYTSLMRNRL